MDGQRGKAVVASRWSSSECPASGPEAHPASTGGGSGVNRLLGGEPVVESIIGNRSVLCWVITSPWACATGCCGRSRREETGKVYTDKHMLHLHHTPPE